MNQTLPAIARFARLSLVAGLVIVVAGCGQAKMEKRDDDRKAASSSSSDSTAEENVASSDEYSTTEDWSEHSASVGASVESPRSLYFESGDWAAAPASEPASAAPDTIESAPSYETFDNAPRMAASEPAMAAPDAVIGGEATAGAAAQPPAAPSPAIDSRTGASMVRVFYGTDRARDLPTGKIGARWFSWEPAAIAGAIGLLFVGAAIWTGWRKSLGAVAGLSFVTMAVLCYTPIKQWFARANNLSGVASYGNERGPLETGVCEVTIPPRHRVGEVESPSILRLEVRADAARHVVLSGIEPLPSEAFYADLKTTVAASPRRELLVFVHGFNVTFDDAVRRTAQIAYDLRFSGAPVCYSWPSQGGLLQYPVDETNSAWTVPHLKEFLLAIVGRTGAQSINLIAHSMGNRALTSVLRDVALEMREEKALFNQVVLAAPDIDAEVFKHDIAPAILSTAQKITLYASSDDQALRASRRVHGYPRAGDSGDDLVVVAGIETIDVSGVDTSFLGHSYYASNDAILSDLHELVHGALPAGRRKLLSPAIRDGLPYWVLQGAAATALRAVETR